MTTPTSSIVLVLVASFVGSFGAVFLKAGADKLERNIWKLVANWRLIAGIFFYLTSFVIYTIAIKHGELTILYPMVSIGYLWTLLWSRLIFNEPFTKNKFVGVGLILGGIVILNMGNR